MIKSAIASSQEVESALVATAANLVSVLPFLCWRLYLLFNELILTISFAVATSRRHLCGANAYFSFIRYSLVKSSQ